MGFLFWSGTFGGISGKVGDGSVWESSGDDQTVVLYTLCMSCRMCGTWGHGRPKGYLLPFWSLKVLWLLTGLNYRVVFLSIDFEIYVCVLEYAGLLHGLRLLRSTPVK